MAADRYGSLIQIPEHPRRSKRSKMAKHRFEKKQSADFIMWIQFAKESPRNTILLRVRVEHVDEITEETVTQTLRRAMSFHSTVQAHDGNWPGDYGGPTFLIPGLAIALSISGALNAVFTPAHKKEIRRYLYNHQNDDGGWGLHIEGRSTMFGSVLTFITLRLLGEAANVGEGDMERGRKWILDHGSATAVISRGKIWLSVKEFGTPCIVLPKLYVDMIFEI